MIGKYLYTDRRDFASEQGGAKGAVPNNAPLLARERRWEAKAPCCPAMRRHCGVRRVGQPGKALRGFLPAVRFALPLNGALICV